MHLSHVSCRNFRCLAALDFAPGPGINLIRGANAQGKTSVLEAILFAATTKSHRTNTDADLARYGEDHFGVTLEAARADREVRIEARWWGGIKRFKVNGAPQTRLSDILGRVRVVFFCPEDVGLVQGGAGGRRRFLDMEISQVDPAYLGALQQYRQVLRQRNELLRHPRPDEDLIAVWDAQLATHGHAIIRARRDFVEQLGDLAAEAYAKLAREEALALAYRPDVRPDDDFASVLRKQRGSDLRRRITTRGPHRDDMDFLVAERPARSHASQGQQKSAALALKLAELELVLTRTGEYPVLLLDEVLAELDEHRSRRLFHALGPGVQCVATTTEQDYRTNRFGDDLASFTIEKGRLTPE